MFPCYRPTKKARFTDSANDQQSRLTWIVKVKRTKASGWKITISLACFCDQTVGNSQQKTLLWNRKIIVTVKINDKVLVLLSFSEPENPQVLLLESVWGFIQKSIISRKGLVPSNNCSNYKDSKRFKQHPLSYPFIQAHGPELHMYHVYYYGNKANLSRAKPTENQTAPLDKICLATSWICWAAAPQPGFPGLWNMFLHSLMTSAGVQQTLACRTVHLDPLGQTCLSIPGLTKVQSPHTSARREQTRTLSVCSVKALKNQVW